MIHTHKPPARPKNSKTHPKNQALHHCDLKTKPLESILANDCYPFCGTPNNIIKRLTAIRAYLVKFDLQKLENPEISGIEYQQGELFGYEVREYLLEKWGRKCTYCDKENVPLQIAKK